MSTKIQNSVALVTGSNRGIGRALVAELVRRGARKVYAAARNVESLQPLVEELGESVVPVALDVTVPEQVAAAAALAADASLVINNAGALGGSDLFTGDLSGARLEFEVNYWGVLHVTRAFAPVLKSNGGGVLVNVSSVAGLSNFPAIPSYSDSKAASHSLTSGSRLLLAGQGTRVMGVYPGPVDTEMAKGIEMEKATPASVAAAILDGVESGAEDVFPDPFAENYAAPYEAGQKLLERRIAEMLQQPA